MSFYSCRLGIYFEKSLVHKSKVMKKFHTLKTILNQRQLLRLRVLQEFNYKVLSIWDSFPRTIHIFYKRNTSHYHFTFQCSNAFYVQLSLVHILAWNSYVYIYVLFKYKCGFPPIYRSCVFWSYPRGIPSKLDFSLFYKNRLTVWIKNHFGDGLISI